MGLNSDHGTTVVNIFSVLSTVLNKWTILEGWVEKGFLKFSMLIHSNHHIYQNIDKVKVQYHIASFIFPFVEAIHVQCLT